MRATDPENRARLSEEQQFAATEAGAAFLAFENQHAHAWKLDSDPDARSEDVDEARDRCDAARAVVVRHIAELQRRTGLR